MEIRPVVYGVVPVEPNIGGLILTTLEAVQGSKLPTPPTADHLCQFPGGSRASAAYNEALAFVQGAPGKGPSIFRNHGGFIHRITGLIISA